MKLFEDAGVDEDSPPFYVRAWNHYHDPLKRWELAGFTYPVLPNGLSSILWAQYDRLPSPPPLISGPNDWTWDAAYQFLLAGLTAQDNTIRNQNLANLFSTLGHLTHLVADMSVPEHTRNDPHVFWDYEKWCEKNLKNVDASAYGMKAFRYEFAPDNAIFAQYQPLIDPDIPLSTVSNLWDTRVAGKPDEDGYNPRLFDNTAPVGLAEYSNFNYFSNDTVFNKTNYTYPSRAESWLDTVTAKDGKIDKVIYFKRKSSGGVSDGVLVSHLAAAKLLYQDWENLTDAEKAAARFTVAAKLDDKCYEEYASNLLPRAVSYGTKMVDYFFRGKFKVTPDGSTLSVQNLSSGTVAGTATVYADAQDGTRTAVTGFIDRAVSLASGEALQWSGFNPSPLSYDNQYRLVFRGRMENTGPSGSTTDNLVAGKVFTRSVPSLPSKIQVGGRPRGLAVAPNGRKLFAANAAGNSVFVVDLSTGLSKPIEVVISSPVEVAISPDSTRLFASHEWGQSVSVIDAVNDSYLRTISDLIRMPEELAVSPDNRYVYVAHFAYYPLTRIDTLNNDSVTLVPGPVRPGQGIALNSAGTRSYLTYYTFYFGNAVAVEDLNGPGLVADLPGPDLNWSAALAGTDNGFLYVANPSLNTVTVYNIGTLQYVTTIPVGSGPRGVAASPDGHTVYVALMGEGKVGLIDTTSNTTQPSIVAGSGAYDVAVSPDGRYLFVSNSFEGTISAIPLGSPAAGAQGVSPMMEMSSSPSEDPGWGTALLQGFPPGCRVYVDGEFPRREEWLDASLSVSFPAGTRELFLFCPGYLNHAVTVTAGPGATVAIDGQMTPE